MPRHAQGRRARDPRRVRPLALAGALAACAVALPLAVAASGSVTAGRGQGVVLRDDGRGAAADSARSGPLTGLSLPAAVRCGPALSSPDGVEARTCVVTEGRQTWARTSYRNLTGEALDAVLSLMGPGGRTVQIHCVAGAGDGPGTCETPREATRGDLAAYTAVAEFADRTESGPLLLRSGSNSPK
ncbi:hypothetical protein AB0K80_15095 [Streptomyces sp. NPDC052682]|uniref:hypothetical protein n=1 Tax=Streptomyces sp. NPDC052682 TaxID=3154954 RepID=UPI00342BC8E6